MNRNQIIAKWIYGMSEYARQLTTARLGISDAATKEDIENALKAAPDWVVNELEGDMEYFGHFV